MELVSTDVPSPRKLFPLPFQRKIHICGLMRSVGLFSLAKMFGEKVDLFLSVLSTRETWFSKHTGLGKVKCLQDKKTVEPRCRAARGMCGHCFFWQICTCVYGLCLVFCLVFLLIISKSKWGNRFPPHTYYGNIC